MTKIFDLYINRKFTKNTLKIIMATFLILLDRTTHFKLSLDYYCSFQDLKKFCQFFFVFLRITVLFIENNMKN